MNTAYVYLQLYKLFDEITPVPVDCGELCSKACCMGDDSGMYLFPGELEVFKLLTPDWAKIENSDFKYTHNNKTYSLPICFCDGSCDRFQRPLACRIFPLTPVLDENKNQVYHCTWFFERPMQDGYIHCITFDCNDSGKYATNYIEMFHY